MASSLPQWWLRDARRWGDPSSNPNWAGLIYVLLWFLGLIAVGVCIAIVVPIAGLALVWFIIAGLGQHPWLAILVALVSISATFVVWGLRRGDS